MADNGQAKFLTGGLMGHVASMSAAGSIGLMAIFLVDLADLYFISLLGEAELAAAVGYSGAILFFTTSVSIGLAIAMGALVARSLGAGNEAQARLYATNVLAFALALSIPVAVLVWVFVPDLVGLVGASGRTADLATQYLRIVVPSLPFMFCLMAGGAILRAHGDARRAMVATIVMGAVNAVLDPLLIFGLGPLPGFGLDGAAAASVAARLAGAVAAMLPIFRRYGGFAPLRIGALFNDLPVITRLAFPAMLTNIATPIGAAFVTREVASFGDAAVAGYAIVGRLTPVAFSVWCSPCRGRSGRLSARISAPAGISVPRARRPHGGVDLSGWICGGGVFAVVCAARADRRTPSTPPGRARELVFWFCGPLGAGFFLQRRGVCRQRLFQQFGAPVHLDPGQLGAAHARHHSRLRWSAARCWARQGCCSAKRLAGCCSPRWRHGWPTAWLTPMKRAAPSRLGGGWPGLALAAVVVQLSPRVTRGRADHRREVSISRGNTRSPLAAPLRNGWTAPGWRR